MTAVHYTRTSYTDPQDLPAALALIATLRDELAYHEYDPAYGLPTRIVLERRAQVVSTTPRALIHLDLDGLNKLNAVYSEDEMNRRIRAAFADLHALVREDDVFCRYRSGDELSAIVPADAAASIATRLQACLVSYGMSGSVVIAPWDDEGLHATIHAAYTRMAATRRGALGIGWRGWGWRGFVVTATGERIGGAYTCPWWARPLAWIAERLVRR